MPVTRCGRQVCVGVSSPILKPQGLAYPHTRHRGLLHYAAWEEEQSLAFLRAVATKRWDQLTRAPQSVKDKVFCTAFGHPHVL